MTRGRLFLTVGAVVASVLVGIAALCWIYWTTPTADTGGDVVIQIPRGAVPSAVADTLGAHDLLSHRTVFLWGARITGRDRAIQAGRYALPRGMPPRDLLDRLVAGRTVPVKVTLLEGTDAATIAAELALSFDWTAETFLAVADSLVREFMADPPLDHDPAILPAYEDILSAERVRTGRRFPVCEGYLFPETYHFAEGLDAARVAASVLGEGATLWRDIIDEAQSPLATFHEVLTLASIVEAETPREEEMPRVAAVYLNRLARRRHLEADPTIAYATNKRGQRILYADLEVASPFNTYCRPGLPPGPICSPGLAAVRAVLTPESGFDALYFVADGLGGHVFSRTLAEHREAVRAYRQRRDAN